MEYGGNATVQPAHSRFHRSSTPTTHHSNTLGFYPMASSWLQMLPPLSIVAMPGRQSESVLLRPTVMNPSRIRS